MFEHGSGEGKVLMASQVVQRLQELIKQHGNLPVMICREDYTEGGVMRNEYGFGDLRSPDPFITLETYKEEDKHPYVADEAFASCFVVHINLL